MNWFLRAKHWQIFILIFAIPLVVEIFGFIIAAVTRMPEFIFVVVFLVMMLAIGTQFGWFYNVGTALAQKVDGHGGINLSRFRSFSLIPAIYISALMLGMIVFGIFMLNHGRPSPFLAFLLIVIIPMHFFSIFCIFYSIWSISKSLKMVERWNHVDLGDYIGEFFLVWFLVVGIWFIQPRINRLFDPTLPPPPPQNPNPYPPNYPPPNYNPYGQNYPPQNYPPQNYNPNSQQYPPQNYPPQNPNQYPPNYPPPGN
jgi:hypothetical protein